MSPVTLCLTVILACFVGCADQGQESSTQPSDSPDANTTETIKEPPYILDEYINEVYIPANLEECFVELDKMLPSDFKDKFKTNSEESTVLHHHGLGLWIRNNWGLWRGSRLAKWFNDRGSLHPDDMSGIILDSYWRRLSNKPIDLEGQLKYYKDYWESLDQ